MKYLKYLLSITFLLTLNLSLTGQEKNYDIVNTKIVKEKVFEKDGVRVKKNIVLRQIRKQEVKTKESQHHLLNQKRANTPLLVEKIVKVDDDLDKDIDLMRSISYSIEDNQVSNLSFTSNGKMFYPEVRNVEIEGNERRIYSLGDEDTTIIGYFNDNDNFVIKTY